LLRAALYFLSPVGSPRRIVLLLAARRCRCHAPAAASQ